MILNANSMHIPLKDKSVHVCVTSPPYYNLRDYQVDGQIGLESTLAQYVINLVKVFREVSRVLRDDGTCWINLGSTYASDKLANQSPLLMRVPSYDIDGKEFLYFQIDGHACSGSCDEPPNENQNHHGNNAHNDRPLKQVFSQPDKTNHDNENLNSEKEVVSGVQDGAQESTTRASWRRDRASCVPSTKASAVQIENRTLLDDGNQFSHMEQNMSGKFLKVQPLVVRTLDKESFFSACDNPNCKGIGKCGLCWCNLAIPSLNIKTKDEIDVPFLVRDALRADGWYTRSDIIWHKKQPMPESVQDRPTKAHEYIFLLSKQPRYFYDAEAVKEETGSNTHSKGKKLQPPIESAGIGHNGWHKYTSQIVSKRNARTVWSIGTEAFTEAHYATFPLKLAAKCIKAGTSEVGACPKCGAPWERVIEKKSIERNNSYNGKHSAKDKQDGHHRLVMLAKSARAAGMPHDQLIPDPQTIGWRMTCKCDYSTPVPCIVFDPFGGASTTMLAAKKLGHRAISLELKWEYCKMGKKRIYKPQQELFLT